MNYSEKYYKELHILKKTKDFLCEELYYKSRMFSDEYNFEELKNKIDNLNTLFELNRFAISIIAQDKDEKELLNRHLIYIQQGALYTFCEYIGENPIGFSYIDNTGEQNASYSRNDSYISSRDALCEIIDELRQLEAKQRTVRLEEILREEIYKASFELSNSQIEYYDSDKRCMEIESKLPQEALEYRIRLYNRFIVDLIKNVYLWFDIDLIELVTNGHDKKLAEILSVGEMDLARFENIKRLVIKKRDGVISNEDLNSIIDDTIKIPRKPKITEDTQSILTQHQILVLFENLRLQRAINKDVSGSMLGCSISLLTGYKQGDSIRQDYSSNYVDIEEREENRLAVISVLENIINKLKEPVKKN